jgi:hypothetical protein
MISYLPKLAIALFLAVAGLSPVLATDILLNGDFSDGKTHWHGDGDVPDGGGKLVITLQPDRWTGVYQSFSAPSSVVQLKMTYTLSNDCSLLKGQSSDAPTPPLTPSALEKATGIPNSIFPLTLSQYYSWMIALVSGGGVVGDEPVDTKSGEGTDRSLTSTLTAWYGVNFVDTDLCLTFPPGHGTVTLTKVEIVPPGIPQQ